MAQTSGLMIIPTEIRLMIYDYTFSTSPFDERPASSALRPLLACRQIYSEARCIAFSHTNFHILISSAEECRRLLLLKNLSLRIHPSQVQAIRHLTLHWKIPYIRQDINFCLCTIRNSPLQLDTVVMIVEPGEDPELDSDHIYSFAHYVLEGLPVTPNIKKLIFPNGGAVNPYRFSDIFNPAIPWTSMLDGHQYPRVLGYWDYKFFEKGADGPQRLELLQDTKSTVTGTSQAQNPE